MLQETFELVNLPFSPFSKSIYFGTSYENL